MKKIALALIASISFAFGVEFDTTKVSINKSIEKQFKTYWTNRGEKKHAKNYGLELPYLQFLHDKKWYENFFANASIIEKVEVVKVVKESKDEIILGINLYLENRKDPVWFNDKWLNVEGKWYHKYDDSLLPRFGN